MINPSRPSPAFHTASDKSWAWRPANEVRVSGRGGLGTRLEALFSQQLCTSLQVLLSIILGPTMLTVNTPSTVPGMPASAVYRLSR